MSRLYLRVGIHTKPVLFALSQSFVKRRYSVSTTANTEPRMPRGIIECIFASFHALFNFRRSVLHGKSSSRTEVV